MSVAVARLSRSFTYLWVNRVYSEWVGRKPSEIIGRTIAQVLGEEAMADIVPRAKEVLAGRRMQYERLSHYRALGKRWVQVTAEPTHDTSGRPDGWVAVVTDVHDHKLAEESLREADRRKDDFLAVLAHELRNPLAPISMVVEVLRRSPTKDEQVRWARDVIGRQVAQLKRLVDDLLDVSRITRGSIEVQLEPVDLITII